MGLDGWRPWFKIEGGYFVEIDGGNMGKDG